MAKKGQKKPAREMTSTEAAERLFGKRVVKRVEKELEGTQPFETPTKSLKKRAIKKQDS